MHPHPRLRNWDWALSVAERHGTPSGQFPGVQQRDPDSRIGCSYRTQPGINETEPIASKGDKAFQGKIASPAGTVHKGPQFLQNKTRVRAAENDGTSAEKRQSATAHEEEKTALVAVGVAGGLAAFGYRLPSQSRAAMRSRVPTAMAKAYKFSASQVAVFPNVLKNQETNKPMITGRAAVALPAKLARARPRACRCYFTHYFKPLLSGD